VPHRGPAALTGIVRSLAKLADRHCAAYHKPLYRAAWALQALRLCLTARAGGPMILQSGVPDCATSKPAGSLNLDDTTSGRSGKHVAHAGWLGASTGAVAASNVTPLEVYGTSPRYSANPVLRVACRCIDGQTAQKEISMKWKTDDGGWSPYLAGALVGLLAVASVYATTRWLGKTSYLGASTTFVRAAGLLEQTVAPNHVMANEYFTKEKVRVDWQFMLVLGIFLGALLSSVTGRSFRLESVPPTWEKRFGPSIWKRAAGAFAGGIVAMVGARMADGCPSGHGLSGTMQLSVSGFVALAMFFGVGVVVAAFVYGRRSS